MLLLSTLAGACPDCPVGGAARALVFSDAFWMNALQAVLPFIVTTLAVRWFIRRLDRGVES